EGGTACASGIMFADPQIGTIGDNGGPTPTIMPGEASAVAGVGVDCPAVDQRGEPRDTSSCAAGSVEP
ncbi:MAG TPA: choice-of-anchor Q domain-containing protein, partial [Enhygromyxa sp.]|nr:choice-of-anchor Q domain-containing protein [Enhygromyxa sp.]